MKHAIELAIDDKIRSGGILGSSIGLLVHDDKSQVKIAEEVAGLLCGEENLLGVIGHYGSDTSLAAARLYQKHNLALLSPIASNPLLTESGLSNVFRYTNRDDRTADAISGYLCKKLKKMKAVVIKTDTAYGNSMAEEFKTAFVKYGGGIVDTSIVNEGEKDFVSLIGQLPDDFDLIFYGGTFEGARLLKALRMAGFDQLMATGDGCWDQVNFLEPAGEAAEAGEGVLVLAASSAIGDIDGSLEFSKRYELKYGAIINYALNAYDAASLLLSAIENAAIANQGIPGKGQVLNAIHTIQFQGIANSNPVAWDHKGDNLGAITKLNIVKEGKFIEVAHIDACHNLSNEKSVWK